MGKISLLTTSKSWVLGALTFVGFSGSGNADVVKLVTDLGPISITGVEQYITISNPLVMTSNRQGSLFFGAVITRHSSSATFSTIGIYANHNNTSVAGGVDIGRNTAAQGFAAFDYLDRKGAGSDVAREGGVPLVDMGVGTYRVVGEIEFTSSTGGSIRAWIADGSKAIDLSRPNLVTSFTSGFRNDPATLYVKLNAGGGQGVVFSSIHANWAETNGDRAAAFKAMVPEPSFIGLEVVGVLGFALIRSRRDG